MSYEKRKKNYYSGQQSKKPFNKRIALDAGMKGFLCTCNFAEKDCVRDSYKILNEYLDKERVSDTQQESNKIDNAEIPKSDDTDVKEKKGDEDEDISDSLQKELNDLKSSSSRVFQAVDTGVKNIIFIQSSVPDPLKLVQAIIKDAVETKKRKTRFILRILPVQVVCKAYMDIIKTKADLLFDDYFVQEPKTFSVVFNRHSNSSIQRNEVIEVLADLIAKKNAGNKVDLKNPEMTVVIEIVRSFCLISIAPHYFLNKKYNLTELYGNDKKAEEQKPEVTAEEEKECEVEEPDASKVD